MRSMAKPLCAKVAGAAQGKNLVARRPRKCRAFFGSRPGAERRLAPGTFSQVSLAAAALACGKSYVVLNPGCGSARVWPWAIAAARCKRLNTAPGTRQLLEALAPIRVCKTGVIFDPPPLRRRLQSQPIPDVSTVIRATWYLNVFANGRGRFANSRGPQRGAVPCGCPFANRRFLFPPSRLAPGQEGPPADSGHELVARELARRPRRRTRSLARLSVTVILGSGSDPAPSVRMSAAYALECRGHTARGAGPMKPRPRSWNCCRRRCRPWTMPSNRETCGCAWQDDTPPPTHKSCKVGEIDNTCRCRS